MSKHICSRATLALRKVQTPGAASPAAVTICVFLFGLFFFPRFFCLPIFDFGKRKKAEEAVTVCLVTWTHLSPW